MDVTVARVELLLYASPIEMEFGRRCHGTRRTTSEGTCRRRLLVGREGNRRLLMNRTRLVHRRENWPEVERSCSFLRKYPCDLHQLLSTQLLR